MSKYTEEDAAEDTSGGGWDVDAHEVSQAWHNARNDAGDWERGSGSSWDRDDKEYVDNDNPMGGYMRLWGAILDDDDD